MTYSKWQVVKVTVWQVLLCMPLWKITTLKILNPSLSSLLLAPCSSSPHPQGNHWSACFLSAFVFSTTFYMWITQSLLITHRFHICKFIYSLKFFVTKVNTEHFLSYSGMERVAETELPTPLFPAEAEHGDSTFLCLTLSFWISCYKQMSFSWSF